VALEATFGDLSVQLLQLQEAVKGLRLTAVEDLPEGDVVMLVQQIGDSAQELVGRLQGAGSHAEQALQAVGQVPDLNGARRSLAMSQEEFMELSGTFLEDFLSFERVGAMIRLGQVRGRDWAQWVESIRRGVEVCTSAIRAVNGAYFHCWQEIAERVGTNSVSVQTTTVGQQIAATKARGR